VTKVSAGSRFAAALALYVLWIAALTAMALTSARSPADRMIPPGAATAAAQPPAAR
jgi:hypothetical protein